MTAHHPAWSRAGARALFAACSAAFAPAQGPTHPHLIATYLSAGNPSTALLEVDVAAGMVVTLPRFALDALPPLAVARDRFDGHPVVALDLGGTTRLVRLEPAGGSFVEHVLADLPGRVVGLSVDGEEIVVGIADLGVHAVPRRGGAARLVRAVPNLADVYPHGATAVLVAWTGRVGTATPDSGIEMVDVATGQTLVGAFTWPNPAGTEITAVVDLPTGAFRQLLGFADGTFALHVAGTVTPVVTTPVVPAGGVGAFGRVTVAGVNVLALGGAAFPFLYDVDAWTGFVSLRSAALPGTPVDVAVGATAFGDSLVMTQHCGGVPLLNTWTGWPSSGTTLTLRSGGPIGLPALLVVGLDDHGPGIPWLLPGGCQLDITPDATVFHVFDAQGQATQPLPIPAGTAFHGTRLFTQWLAPDLVGISSSSAVVHVIGW
jgi:hypothetical protein